MGSTRFPGKVLAPFRGEPIVLHVVRAAADALGADRVVVLTSDTAADDPLAAYLSHSGIGCLRGPLDDVFERFRLAATAYPSEWIVRLCADSPLLDPGLIREVVRAAGEGTDVVTTVFPRRAVPKGSAVEMVRSTVLLAVPPGELDDKDREHVFTYFYRHADAYSIRSVEPRGVPSGDVVVDTIDDLRRLEGRG